MSLPSLNYQTEYGGAYVSFAKALVNLDEILQNAVLIERHTDKYKGTIRESENLENVSVLLGMFWDGNELMPVQMEIKKTTDSGDHLYVTVTTKK